MPEKIKQELDKWETRSKNTLQKIKKLPGKVTKEVREEYTELRQGGRKLIKQIDSRLDKAEGKTKEALKNLRKRFKKLREEIKEAWKNAGEEPVIDFYEIGFDE